MATIKGTMIGIVLTGLFVSTIEYIDPIIHKASIKLYKKIKKEVCKWKMH